MILTKLNKTRKALGSFPHIYSSDWTSSQQDTWSQVLAPIAGKPELNYLEIGVFQGRSSVWMLANILSHPSSRMTAVDIFSFSPRWIYQWNLFVAGFLSKVTILKGKSGSILPTLPSQSYDLIYVDGSHTAQDVQIDARESWRLLKTGGILIFDDYAWGRESLPIDERPETSIDLFIEEHEASLEVLHKDWQVICKRTQ